MDESEYCESKIAVVCEAMTHVHYDVFCSSYWKKNKFFYYWEPVILSTAEHAKTDIQTITDECVNRPVLHPSLTVI